MIRGKRATVAVVGAVVVFVAALLLSQMVAWPSGTSDRWVVDAAFASITSAAWVAGVTLWPGKESGTSGDGSAASDTQSAPHGEEVPAASAAEHNDFRGATFNGPVQQGKQNTQHIHYGRDTK